MREVLKVGQTRVKPGKVVKGFLGSVELADGSKASIPVININGAEDGPVLTVVSGVHGNELSPIGAVWKAVQQVDPSRLKGALLAITGANPLACRVGAYKTPLDGTNLSGPWYLPTVDQATANITQRMAFFVNEALDAADYVLDMHANPLPSIPFVLTDLEMAQDDKVRAGIQKIAEAFGVTVINWPRKQATSIRDICAHNGKPSITPELAGNVFLWDDISQVGTTGILNVMKAIGMLEGEIEKQEVDSIPGELAFYGWLYAQCGGYLYARKKPGELIGKGETVIEILDVFGDPLEEVKMPINGYCWSFTGGVGGSHAVSQGDKLAYVFAQRSELGQEPAFVEKTL